MVEEEIQQAIRDKINEVGYKSANLKLALVKEGGSWKILAVRIVFDISNPQGQTTQLKEDDFRLENFSISIDRVKQFLDYLRSAYVGNIKFQESSAIITDEHLFSIGDYKLCFIGNFPSRELYFYSRKVSREYHGIDRPIYFTDFAIHSSVKARSYPQMVLTDHEPPFSNVTEALNHYWNTSFEQYNIPSTGLGIYMPVFDASIEGCKVKENKLILSFDIDFTRTKLEELSVAVIAKTKTNNYRKRHELHDKKSEIDLDFKPDYASIYLNKNGKRIDDYNYQSPEEEARVNRVLERVSIGTEEAKELGIATESSMEKESESLFDQNITKELPKPIQTLLYEAQIAFNNELYRSVSILLRSALEEGLTILIQQVGKNDDLYDNGYEIGLHKKIKLVIDSLPEFRQIKADLDAVKWFGDKASHEASMPIIKRDIYDTEPKFRLILVKLIEFLSKRTGS